MAEFPAINTSPLIFLTKGSCLDLLQIISPSIIVRLLANMQRIVVVRFRTPSDADGYLRVIQRLIPDGKFLVVFDGDTKSEVCQDCR